MTLVEVIIALAVLAIVLVLSFSVFQLSIDVNQASYDKLSGQEIANNQIESIMAYATKKTKAQLLSELTVQKPDADKVLFIDGFASPVTEGNYTVVAKNVDKYIITVKIDSRSNKKNVFVHVSNQDGGDVYETMDYIDFSGD